ncbi:MAG: DUF4097 family beta strand repeat protein [Acidobacteria bacterium]|nr:DUF4097 family beta strand repeat protein [Acidobacteriota bacterium]
MRIAALVATVVLGLAAGACTVRVDSEEHTAREEKRFKVAAEPEVRVATFDGSIEVHSWDRDEVLVEVEKRGPDEEALKSIRVRAEQQGNRIEVDVTRPSGRDNFVGIGIHIGTAARLTVTVPRRVVLQVRSGDGSIRADRLEGRIELRTSDGSVRADEVKGTLDVETHDGSITADEVDGEATLSTRDGGINVSGRLSILKAKTGDGSVTIRADRGSVMAAGWSIITEDGAVAVYLPEPFAAEVDAQTDDGRVRSDFELEAEREDGHRRRWVRGKIGGGGHQLRIRTGDGSISLRNW